MLEMYTDDVQFEDVIFAHTANGKEGLRKFFSSLGGPDAGEHVFTCTAYSGSAESGAVEWTWHTKHAGEFDGSAPYRTALRPATRFSSWKSATMSYTWTMASRASSRSRP